ncbi:hypothetical protein ACFE04_029972 [Oxalis oulophora]
MTAFYQISQTDLQLALFVGVGIMIETGRTCEGDDPVLDLGEILSLDQSQGSAQALKAPRVVVRKFLARPQHEGVGATVRRSIGRFELKYFDPFLALDEFSVTAPAEFPDHPHRGFETVTYMLQVIIGRVMEMDRGDFVMAGESRKIKKI